MPPILPLHVFLDHHSSFPLFLQDVMGKIDPESVIDSVECDLDDINDDAINITADDDQLLTEDVSPLS